MRLRSASLFLALSVLSAAGLASCGSPASDAMTESPPGEANSGNSGSEGGTGGAKPTTEAAELAAPTAVDIRTVDLANTTWLYSWDGFAAPEKIVMIDGTAVVADDGFPATYTLGEISYGDIDADGDEDAVGRINRAQDNGYKALWYAWLAQGVDAVQVKYPIAETGRCGTFVESVVFGDGAVTVTEYLRVPGQDDGIPCSDPGTGLKQRTVTIHVEGIEAWPVQTAPVAAWGGLCTGPQFPDTSPGIVKLWVAPTQDSAVAATASSDGGAVFAQKDAPLMHHDGWALVGFRVFGVDSDVGGADMACAWALD